MYGQTGSGKTYTMMGSANRDLFTKEKGVLNLALDDIFSIIGSDLEKTYFIKCSYIEIYNDFIYDLLKPVEELSCRLGVSSN